MQIAEAAGHLPSVFRKQSHAFWYWARSFHSVRTPASLRKVPGESSHLSEPELEESPHRQA